MKPFGLFVGRQQHERSSIVLGCSKLISPMNAFLRTGAHYKLVSIVSAILSSWRRSLPFSLPQRSLTLGAWLLI